MEDMGRLRRLLDAYEKAPVEFQATRYWQTYGEAVLRAIKRASDDDIRSGRYPIFSTFGFTDALYLCHPTAPIWKRIPQGIITRLLKAMIVGGRPVFPYHLTLGAIREMAYHHCELLGGLCGARPVGEIGMSTFGNPQDCFVIRGKEYSISFLNYYVRYCFAQKHARFRGDEILVELGSGSGYQTEVLRKLYPDMTFLCFDLPAQIFLCETYLTKALGSNAIVGTDETRVWTDLAGLKPGHVHFFGNWQFPLLKDFAFDVFWNAASFGEMEPDIVAAYLSYIMGNARWVYLLQAREGKETTGKAHVNRRIAFGDYDRMLRPYELVEEHDAYHAHMKLAQSGGYFEAIWKKR